MSIWIAIMAAANALLSLVTAGIHLATALRNRPRPQQPDSAGSSINLRPAAR
jgi:hypothetical protein